MKQPIDQNLAYARARLDQINEEPFWSLTIDDALIALNQLKEGKGRQSHVLYHYQNLVFEHFEGKLKEEEIIVYESILKRFRKHEFHTLPDAHYLIYFPLYNDVFPKTWPHKKKYEMARRVYNDFTLARILTSSVINFKSIYSEIRETLDKVEKVYQVIALLQQHLQEIVGEPKFQVVSNVMQEINKAIHSFCYQYTEEDPKQDKNQSLLEKLKTSTLDKFKNRMNKAKDNLKQQITFITQTTDWDTLTQKKEDQTILTLIENLITSLRQLFGVVNKKSSNVDFFKPRYTDKAYHIPTTAERLLSSVGDVVQEIVAAPAA